MKKIYYISESQFKNLVEVKKKETSTYKEICEELKKKRTQIREGDLLNEGVIDSIKNYLRTGVLTVSMLASLLASNQVNTEELTQAGVPKATIEQAIQKSDNEGGKKTVKYDPSQMSNKDIEDRLLQIMKKNRLNGSIRDYNNLNSQQKENILNSIKSQIKSLDDVNQIAIGGWEKFDKTNTNNTFKFDTDKTTVERISAITVDTVSTVPVKKSFQRNSFKLQNPDQLKQELNDLVKGYSSIDSIVIETSSSALRNTGDAEGMTWKQLSQKRGEEVANLLIGQKIDLGGEGKNLKGDINSNMVNINSDGQNGDGTSGPKSPFESNSETVKDYQNRGLDASLWKSAAKEQALDQSQINDYEQYQVVNVKIYGRVVEETKETIDTYNYRYITLKVNEMNGRIKTGNKKEKTDISKCTVKVRKVDHVKMKENIVA